ncbi:hypothetical protein [Micromonospora antibiotica]|uniref:Uncharacterized protein n=1 Tax=Micromonospora antibiotica TaxID=2807623 RepID=A0ABS3V350_9ACTN|nr:hypothetical protein [Micromonospora antibiotica]MBO4160046.1 hypothetical protein [Micromonospora antibiotica]
MESERHRERGPPTQTWQTYEIECLQARYDAAGVTVANPRVTVVWNGVTVHDDVEILRPTGGSRPAGPTAARAWIELRQ